MYNNLKKRDKGFNIMKVFKNFRDYTKNDIVFNTDEVCNNCGNQSPIYAEIDEKRYCKACLYNFIEKLDNTYIEYCKNCKR
jgi:predicted metalloprotease